MMTHEDHMRLLRDGIHRTDGIWADFGSGRGAFTLALVNLLSTSAQVYSVDMDSVALATQQKTMEALFPQVTVHYLEADFSVKQEFPSLDGIVMANSLHYVSDKGPMLRLLHDYLKDDGRLILVEYNTDQGNVWVPYPLSYSTWEQLSLQCGFVHTKLLQRVPSTFLGEFYSASSEKGIVK